MVVSSELRANAREALKGKWGKAALLTLFYSLITFAIAFLLNLVPFIGPIVQLLINLPISFGFLVMFIKLRRDEEVNYTDFLSIGFSYFGKVWGVFGNMLLKNDCSCCPCYHLCGYIHGRCWWLYLWYGYAFYVQYTRF